MATRRAVPVRTLVLSIGALTIPALATVFLPEWLERDGALLIWLPAIVPAFLLTFHRGWHGASLSLAGGMSTLALTQVEIMLLDLPVPGWNYIFVIVIVLLSVSLGTGWMGELLLRAREAAVAEALTDRLTGLPNRRHASLVLDAAWGAVQRGGALAVILFDLDEFKRVNDTHGHGEGDRVLKAFGEVLSTRTRRMDLSARFGGEEFISILPNCPADRAVAFAEEVREQLAGLHFAWGQVTASAGVAVMETGMGSPDVLVAAADRALYDAKARGRNRVCRADESITRPSVPSPPSPSPAEAKSLDEARILVVDDDLDTLHATSRLLTRFGASVTSADSPREAVGLMTSGERFDLLVTDIVMPEMSGFTLVDLATRVIPDLAVLYMSGYAQEDVYWGGTPGARSAFLSKPVEIDELVAALTRLLEPISSASEQGPSISGTPAVDTPARVREEADDAYTVTDARILVVDDEPRNVKALVRLLKRGGYPSPIGLTDPRKVRAVVQEEDVDLLILDLNMPEMDGFEVMNALSDLIEPGEYFPILILTGEPDIELRRKALAAGAMDFLAKPFDTAEAEARVRNLLATRRLTQRIANRRDDLEAMVRERTTELADTRSEILHRLAIAAEYRDDITGRHAERVGLMASLIAEELGMTTREVDLIRRTAPLHDVGKIGVPDAILRKPGRLTESEFELMKTHTVIGEQILGGSHREVLEYAGRIALAHHERWDGAGYPHGLIGAEIPIEARIVSVADVLDVLSHARPYKEASPLEDAVAELVRCAGSQFDPDVIDAFGRIADRAGLDNLYSLSDPIDPLSDTVGAAPA